MKMYLSSRRPIGWRMRFIKKRACPAYHMNKKNWISILLNDTVQDKVPFDLLDESHNFTIKNKISKTEKSA